MGEDCPVQLSYCVVNTSGREHVLACLRAIERTAPPGLQRETLVLDNATGDGSIEAVRELGGGVRLIERAHRGGKAENDNILLKEARGRYCLLLNEDAELQEGAPQALIGALEANPDAGAAGSQLLDPAGWPADSAWRLPGLGTALAGALFLHRWFTVQSETQQVREVGWAQSSAMLVRREAAEQIGYLDPDFFVYSDETDFCKRLWDAGWKVLFVPAARAIHHEQLATDAAGAPHRVVEFHRNRDLYLRKHRGRVVAAVARPLQAWPYLVRAVIAPLRRAHSSRMHLLHARQALSPGRGEGLRELATARPRLEAPPPASRS